MVPRKLYRQIKKFPKREVACLGHGPGEFANTRLTEVANWSKTDIFEARN